MNKIFRKNVGKIFQRSHSIGSIDNYDDVINKKLKPVKSKPRQGSLMQYSFSFYHDSDDTSVDTDASNLTAPEIGSDRSSNCK